MSYRINGARWNAQPFNGQGNLATIAADFKVLYNQRSINLDWGTVDGANYYQLQVSLFPDFRSNFLDISVGESDYQFTDAQTDDMKRYWRWRPSVSSGADWLQPWSDVAHYWLDTSAPLEIEVPNGNWVIFDVDDPSDIYWFDMIPTYTISSKNLFRFQGRNRVGELLSEFLTVKDDIVLDFTGKQYVAHPQLDEFERFNNAKRVFFMANYVITKYAEPTPHIWKVEFVADPAFTMIAAGRQDFLQGALNLTEV
ncbi:MAG: hypothetical protein UMS36scaffold28_25 [Phage 59_13]|nr:MAG: hypothetical protein UMS36scaffold28_25 [Phage 59_13]